MDVSSTPTVHSLTGEFQITDDQVFSGSVPDVHVAPSTGSWVAAWTEQLSDGFLGDLLVRAKAYDPSSNATTGEIDVFESTTVVGVFEDQVQPLWRLRRPVNSPSSR